MKRRSKFITSFVLAFYLSYALLPLLIPAGQVPDNAPSVPACPLLGHHRVPAAAQDVRLIPAPDPDDDGLSDSAASILVKKKRAVAVSFRKIAAESSCRYVRLSDSGPSFKRSLFASHIPGETRACPDGFCYYHSGISPPLA